MNAMARNLRRNAGRDRGLKALVGDDGLCLPVMSKHPRAHCHHSWWASGEENGSWGCAGSLTSVLVCILFLYPFAKSPPRSRSPPSPPTELAVIEFALMEVHTARNTRLCTRAARQEEPTYVCMDISSRDVCWISNATLAYDFTKIRWFYQVNLPFGCHAVQHLFSPCDCLFLQRIATMYFWERSCLRKNTII